MRSNSVVIVAAFVVGFATATIVACFFGLRYFDSFVVEPKIPSPSLIISAEKRSIDSAAKTTIHSATLGEASSNYLSEHFTRGGASRIECFLRGRRVPYDTPADCHGRPPFWRWWHDYRNCYASNVCLRAGQLEVFRGAGQDHELDALAQHKSLACVDWISAEDYTVIVRDGLPPDQDSAIWHDEPSLHSSRILPGQFGHDVLNTLFYGFETFARANLSHWLRSHPKKPSHFAVERDPIQSDVLDMFFDYTHYGPRSKAWHEYHCFSLAMVSASHSLDANLVFRRNSPTLMKKRTWHQYRDSILERFVCGGRMPCHLLRMARSLSQEPRSPMTCGTNVRPLRITVFARSTKYGSSKLLTANGRGRRVNNNRELLDALAKLGHVVEADPGSMSLRDQQRLMLQTDVLVSRMGSSTVNAMFMPPGGLCVEIEAPDPAHLYYDHPSTFEELAEIFDHDFVRSTDANETTDALDPATYAVIGDVTACCEECSGPPGLAALIDRKQARQCCRRCNTLFAEAKTRRERGGYNDIYLRPNWFMNWWLSDCQANVPEIVDLIQQKRPCPSARDAVKVGAQAYRAYSSSQAMSGATTALGWHEEQSRTASPKSLRHCSYESSPWEREWRDTIDDRESDDPEWTLGCEAMREAESKAERWINWIAGTGNGGVRTPPPRAIFSGWKCAPDKNASRKQIVIEPLVGHLRHPYFHCIGSRKDTLDLMFSRDYLVLATADDVPRGATKLFFDAGASNAYDNCWWGCTKWFVDEYGERGIAFDRILLWEGSPVDHSSYWATVPSYLKPKMQYFNTPLTPDPPDLWRAILALAKPDDFVVVKLDIDNYEIEVEYIRQLLSRPDVLALIDELFWEHHVNGSPLRRTRVNFPPAQGIGWGNQVPQKGSRDGHLQDSYRLFARLRQHGIRAHAWV